MERSQIISKKVMKPPALAYVERSGLKAINAKRTEAGHVNHVAVIYIKKK